VLPKSLIASQVWDMNFDSDTNVIEVAIRRLRLKIDDSHANKLIHTVRGMGYVLEERQTDAPPVPRRPPGPAVRRLHRQRLAGCRAVVQPRQRAALRRTRPAVAHGRLSLMRSLLEAWHA
jgi:hypothetical protein